MRFDLNGGACTIYESRIEVYVQDQQDEAAKREESYEDIEPTLVPPRYLDDWYEAIPKSSGIEEIGEDPHVVVEHHDQQIDHQSHQNDTH